MDSIDTVGDLIATLEDYDPDTRVRLATQPLWPCNSLALRRGLILWTGQTRHHESCHVGFGCGQHCGGFGE